MAGPESLGADIFGVLSLGGEILGALTLGLQHPGLQHDIPLQLIIPHIPHPPQHLAFGMAGPESLGADIFGALSLGGLRDGAFNLGLQQVLCPQHEHESLRFYQHPTLLAIFGPSSFGAVILGALIFGADIFGAFIFGAGARAAFNLFGPYLSILPADGINIA
jgi:hypothetical protein